MKKLSNITESVWADIHKRSNGTQERKEDDVNILSFEDFFSYLQKNYKDKSHLLNMKYKRGIKVMEIPLFARNKLYFFIELRQYKSGQLHIDFIIPKSKLLMDLYTKIDEEFTLVKYGDEQSDGYFIYPKDRKKEGVTNLFVIKVIDFILANTYEPLTNTLEKVKDIDESVWSDIHKRSNGEVIRKEDITTNIRDLVPVDMGVTVLWADRDLEWKDGGCYFNYNEASNIIKNSKWRIPTKQESYELFQYTTMIKNTDEVCIQEGKFDDKPQLIFNKKGYQYGDSDKVFQKSMYAMWTSTETKEIEAYYMSVIARMNDNHYTSMHYGNRICVRLVKDK